MNLEGEIREINLVERLVELWREKFTGAIRFENDGVIKIVYCKTGDILSASTNDRADSVDEILMRAGKVSREHVKQALAKRKENETLGDALLNLGFITRKELTWARRVQVINVIRSIDQWGAGSFTIVADYLPKREEGTIFPLPQVLVELIVTDQDRQKYERELASGSAVFSKAADFTDAFPRLGLNEDAEKIVAQIDGERTASDVAAASGQEAFNTFKLMHALSVLGLLNRVGVAAPPGHAASEFEMAGAADAADAWSVPMPQFDLDDAPPVAVPSINPATNPTSDSAPVTGSQLQFDEQLVSGPPVVPSAENRMPGWDMPPRGASPTTAPAPEPPADSAEEPQWGFDEALIETARQATVHPIPSSPLPEAPRRPVLSKPKQKKRSFGLIVALMVVFILGGLAYGGFLWWSGRQAPSEAVLVPRAKRPPVRPTTATETTATTASTEDSAPVTTATRATATTAAPPVTIPTTTTAAAARPPAPLVISPPKPAQQTSAPKPPPPELVRPVTAAGTSSARERFDAMAREYASSPQGNFTVQFEIVCEPSNVEKALNAGGSNVWFIPISIKGRGCYRVFWGHYATRDAGERGMVQIPAVLREGKPAVIEVPKP